MKKGYTVVSEEITENDLTIIRSDGANVIRYMIYNTYPFPDYNDYGAYKTWLETQLIKLDSILLKCKILGIKVAIDLHTPPGDRNTTGSQRLFYDKVFLGQYVETWQKIASRYKDYPAIYGYGLMNEPVVNSGNIYKNIDVQTQVANEIRKIDSKTPIIFSFESWNAPDPFFVIPINGIHKCIYEVHMYQQMEFTHQFVYPNFNKAYTYPGVINGWDVSRPQLEFILQKVRNFQLAFDARIFVGEFSAVRWANGAAKWLGDCVDIFNEYEWDWVYHAYTKETHWSLDYENGTPNSTSAISDVDTDRKIVVKNGFK